MLPENRQAVPLKTIEARVAELVAAAPAVTAEQREAAISMLIRRRPFDNRPAGRPRGGTRAA